jgi:deazaflavin-dependent oxidoreductase (nitroreductase family)
LSKALLTLLQIVLRSYQNTQRDKNQFIRRSIINLIYNNAETFWDIIGVAGDNKMSKVLSDTDSSKGLLRIGVRLPVLLYRARLGWILGGRFLMLTTTDRKTGLPRHTVLEVVLHEQKTDTYYVVPDGGEKSDWFRNIQKSPTVVVNVGLRQFEAVATRLSQEDAERALTDYTRQHSHAARFLTRMMVGLQLDTAEDQSRSLAHSIPLVALKPVNR